MKSLQAHITESFKDGLLKYNFEALPADWRKFSDKCQTIGLQHALDSDDELIHNGKVTVARYDVEDMKVYTDLTKKEFFDVALRQNFSKVKTML